MALKNRTPEVDTGITDINLTPLVDVCLVLVIIFMAIAPFALKTGINVLRSKSGAAQGKASVSENVMVKLTKDGKITVNGKAIDNGPTTLLDMIAGSLELSKDRMVIVSADGGNRVGEVVSVLDISKQAGAIKLAVMQNE